MPSGILVFDVRCLHFGKDFPVRIRYNKRNRADGGRRMKNRILVIEDDKDISDVICMNLEAAGYAACPVYDGRDRRNREKWPRL